MLEKLRCEELARDVDLVIRRGTTCTQFWLTVVWVSWKDTLRPDWAIFAEDTLSLKRSPELIHKGVTKQRRRREPKIA